MDKNTHTRKKKVRLIVGVCTCARNTGRQQAVRDTWMQDPPAGTICRFYTRGEGGKVGEEGDTVYLDAPDDYAHLSHKLIAFFYHILSHYDFDYLFKCDDDSYVHLERLQELLDMGLDLVGDMSLLYRGSPSGGAGYLISRRILEQIVQQEDIPLMVPEDVLFGEMARELGATYAYTTRLCLRQLPYPMPYNNFISAHWCSPSYMRAIHAFQTETPHLSYVVTYDDGKEDMLLFYVSGNFRKKSTGRAGRYEYGEEKLTLHWFAFPPDTLFLEAREYRGAGMRILPMPYLQGTENKHSHE